MTSETNSNSLRTVAPDRAFHFYTSVGNTAGMSASSMKEFMDKINRVNVKSLEFHLARGDFEKWSSEVLGDQTLASEIRKVQKMGLMGERLRGQLYLAVSRRFRYLTSPTGAVYSSKSH